MSPNISSKEGYKFLRKACDVRPGIVKEATPGISIPLRRFYVMSQFLEGFTVGREIDCFISSYEFHKQYSLLISNDCANDIANTWSLELLGRR